MRLGITQLLPTALAQVDAASVRRVRQLGFAGTALNINDDPATISQSQAESLGALFAAEGVSVVEYGQYHTTFVTPDDAELRAQFDTVREACRVAQTVGCPVVIVGIGSRNPRGHWFAHPDNFTAAIRARLVQSLREAARIAGDAGVTLALECHITTTLRDAETARMVLDEIGSPVLKVHLDPVNWMTFETILANAEPIRSMFDTLGPDRISGAHSKGATLADRLIIHMDETYTGAPDDLIDHAAVLSGLAALGGDPWLVIEHLAEEHMPHARAHLLAIAHQHNLPLSAPEPTA